MDSLDPNSSVNKGYALSGKIMLSAIVILFFVVILMVCLHLYARWYLLRARRRHHRRVRHRRTHLVFYADHDNNNPANATVPARGLDSNVLKTIPVFVFDPKTNPEPVECAVCLSEFEEKETGRILPKCKHSFHIECIDMWFHSHSTCPLCRSPVEPIESETDGSTESEPVSDSGAEGELCDTCQHEIGGTSSSGKPVELVGITIEVPTRSGFGDESNESPTSQSFRSPMSRMLSFTRILSRDRRSSLSPRSCGELDIELNRQTQSGVGGTEE